MRKYPVNDSGEEVEDKEYWKLRFFFEKQGIPYNKLSLQEMRALISLYTSCETTVFPKWSLGNTDRFKGKVAFLMKNEDDEEAFDAWESWYEEVSGEDEEDIDTDTVNPRPWELYPDLLCDTSTWCINEWKDEESLSERCINQYTSLNLMEKSRFCFGTGLIPEARHRNIVNFLNLEIERLQSNLGTYIENRQEEDPWIWMNSFEENDLDSMSNGCVIKISAGQLRDLLERVKRA